jgi:hypothetical protein
MSGVHQIQEQNEQILAATREQNELLRQRLGSEGPASSDRPETTGSGESPSD